MIDIPTLMTHAPTYISSNHNRISLVSVRILIYNTTTTVPLQHHYQPPLPHYTTTAPLGHHYGTTTAPPLEHH